MLQFLKPPLAWLNLTHDISRLVLAVAGVAFAVLLMFIETGFRNCLFDSQVALIHKLDADLIIENKAKVTVAIETPFARRRIYQAMAVEGVESVYPVYSEHEISLWKNFGDRSIHPIRVLAFNPEYTVFKDRDINAHSDELKMPDTALFDAKSKRVYGRFDPGTISELTQRKIKIVGNFRLGTEFVNDGNLIMSDRNFLKYFPDRPSSETRLERVEFGVVKAAAGADIVHLQRKLREALPGDVEILTIPEWLKKEIAFWAHSTAIGFVFDLGTVMGFLVGVIICYQILFTDVTNHLPQFGTLKAIGYQNSYLVGVLLQEAFLLSILGFVPGVLLTYMLFLLIENMTGLPMQLTLARAGLILALTIPMCIISGVIAMRRALASDPADVFA